MNGSGHQPAAARTRGNFAIKLGTLSALSLAAVLLALLALQLQGRVLNMVLARSQVSEARIQCVAELRAWLRDGREQHLVDARAALAVPLALIDAAAAIDARPSNPERARVVLDAVRFEPERADDLISTYRWAAHLPYVQSALQVWRESGKDVAGFDALIRDMSAHSGRALDAARLRGFTQRVDQLDASMVRHERDFDDSLLSGLGRMKPLVLAVVVVLLALSALAMWQLLGTVERRIRRSERSFRSVFDRATQGMVRTDLEGRVLHANDTMLRSFGAAGMSGLWDSASLVAPADEARWRDFLNRAGQSPEASVVENFAWDGVQDARTVQCAASLVQLPVRGGQASSLLLVFNDVTETVRYNRLLEHQASHDVLTDVLNRSEMERRIDEVLDQARADPDTATHALLLLNLDRFRLINDTCGHPIGDRLLVRTARRLRSYLRDTDAVGRLSGDEFLVLLRGYSREDAEAVATRINATLSDAGNGYGPCTFKATCSIGMVPLSGGLANAREAILAADTACHLAKQHGGNRVHCHVEADAAVQRRRQNAGWVGELRSAIDSDRLRLWAQPIVACNGTPNAWYEVLVRVEGVDGRLHMPGEFLPAAELYGMSPELDRAIIAQSIRELGRQRPSPADGELCFINLSNSSLSSKEFRTHVYALLDAHPELSRRLCFEITENGVMSDLQYALEFITQVRKFGCKVALDDFGTGLSSFSHLRVLPADIIKIDGAFVRDLDSNRTGQVLLRSICEMSRILGKLTVAEWIDSEAIATCVRDAGADYMQGYHLGKPQPLDALLQALPEATAKA